MSVAVLWVRCMSKCGAVVLDRGTREASAEMYSKCAGLGVHFLYMTEDLPDSLPNCACRVAITPA
jgi:hypothetical protein